MWMILKLTQLSCGKAFKEKEVVTGKQSVAMEPVIEKKLMELFLA